MPAFNALAAACAEGGKYYGKARFVVVYIAEAHAGDEWPIGWRYEPSQHQCYRDRCENAIKFQQEFGITAEMTFAPIDGEFEDYYKPWPFRFFGIRRGRIELNPKPIPGMQIYDLVEIWEYLDKL